MYIYIKKGLRNPYQTFEDLIPEEGFEVGTTYSDYLNNKWVLLTDEQVKFHEEHPEATIKQVLDMFIPAPPERTVNDAKREMLSKIERYDTSTAVNGFTINNAIEAWFTVQERLNYKQSVESAKLFGIPMLSFFVGEQMLQIEPGMAEQMLAALQMYADQCYIVTQQHKIAVNKLETIEECDNYPYMSGYPARLNFDIVPPMTEEEVEVIEPGKDENVKTPDVIEVVPEEV